jgi:hypothetical protein
MRSVLHFKQNISLIPKLTTKELTTKNPLLLRTYATSPMRSSSSPNQIVEGNKWNLRAYIEKLFTIPRGFKKFYPKEKTDGKTTGGTPKEKQSSQKNDSTNSTEKGTENTFKSKKRQTNGPKKDGEDPMANLIPIALTVTAIGAVLFMMDSKGNGYGSECNYFVNLIIFF